MNRNCKVALKRTQKAGNVVSREFEVLIPAMITDIIVNNMGNDIPFFMTSIFSKSFQPEDWEKFAQFEVGKYTRNLVHAGNPILT